VRSAFITSGDSRAAYLQLSLQLCSISAAEELAASIQIEYRSRIEQISLLKRNEMPNVRFL